MALLLLILSSAYATTATFYYDGDNDGYGDPGDTIVADSLSVPPGYVRQTGDCDDGIDTIYPSASEVCNGLDDDCDGVVDEGVSCGCTHDTWSEQSYQFCMGVLNHADADAQCDSMGYGMAHVDDSAENTYLYNKVVSLWNNWWWLGANDIASEGTWVWNDGTPWNYTNWYPGQPNNYGNYQHCLTLNGFGSQWNDEWCNYDLPYVCKAEADLQVWFWDDDGDGYGDPTLPFDSATQPSDHVPDNSDCDDLRDATYPGAPELCNGIDDDCDGLIDNNAVGLATYYPDVDGDGYGTNAGAVQACSPPPDTALLGDDCNDNNAAINPGVAEVTCDGLNNDCSGATPDDTNDDGDAYSVCNGDCNDSDPDVYPTQAETQCDGLDNDCDIATLDGPDGDGDGVSVCTDCNDNSAAIFPGNAETNCNGFDDDCDPLTLDDADLDGDGVGGCTDCDDTNANMSPLLPEIACDGINNDCNAASPDGADQDLDGYDECVDCDDQVATTNPGAPELTCDTVDNDCDADTIDNPDGDGDGSDVCLDCDDSNPLVSPEGIEAECDGLDNDCDITTTDGLDADGDGFSGCFECDDTNAAIYPENVETTCNTIDDDCDTDTLDDPPDADGDGQSECEGDCDDTDSAIYEGATEIADNGIDEDCDGGDLVTGTTGTATGSTTGTGEVPPDSSRTWDASATGTNADTLAAGCDCDSGTGPVSWVWLGLALVGFRRKR